MPRRPPPERRRRRPSAEGRRRGAKTATTKTASVRRAVGSTWTRPTADQGRRPEGGEGERVVQPAEVRRRGGGEGKRVVQQHRRANRPEPIRRRRRRGGHRQREGGRACWAGVVQGRPKQMWISCRWRSQLNKSSICCRSAQNNTGPAEASETEAKGGTGSRQGRRPPAAPPKDPTKPRRGPPGGDPGGAQAAEEPPGEGGEGHAEEAQRQAAGVPQTSPRTGRAPAPPPAGTSRGTSSTTSSAPWTGCRQPPRHHVAHPKRPRDETNRQ